MRNIQDIISEQKTEVDVKLLSFELQYILEDFSYVQEGIVEGVKNIIKGVIEFIKKIINKIKEFIGKIIDLLFGRKKRVAEINNEIKTTNAGGNAGSSQSGEKNGSSILASDDAYMNMWREFTAAVKGNDRREIIVQLCLASDDNHYRFRKCIAYITKNNPSVWEKYKETEPFRPKNKWDDDYLGLVQSDLSYNLSKERAEHLCTLVKDYRQDLYRKNPEMEKKDKEYAKLLESSNIETTNKKTARYNNINDILKNSNFSVKIKPIGPIDKKLNVANQFFNCTEKAVNEISGKGSQDYKNIDKSIIDKTFNGNANIGDLAKLFALNTGESDSGEQTIKVSAIANIIIGYLDKSDDVAKYLRAKEKSMVDNLNRLIRDLERIENSNNDERIVNEKVHAAKSVSNLIGNFINVVCSSIAKNSSIALQVAEKAKADYIKSIK